MYSDKKFNLPQSLIDEAEKIVQGKKKGAEDFGADAMKGNDPATENAKTKASQRENPNTPGKQPVKDVTDKIEVDEDSTNEACKDMDEDAIGLSDFKPKHYINSFLKGQRKKFNKQFGRKDITFANLKRDDVRSHLKGLASKLGVNMQEDQLDHGEKVVDRSAGLKDPIHNGQGEDGQDKGDKKINAGAGINGGVEDPINHSLQGNAQVHEAWDYLNDVIESLIERQENTASLLERGKLSALIEEVISYQDSLTGE